MNKEDALVTEEVVQSLFDRYQIYVSCSDNGAGIDITTGAPLKTYEEWLNS